MYAEAMTFLFNFAGTCKILIAKGFEKHFRIKSSEIKA